MRLGRLQRFCLYRNGPSLLHHPLCQDHPTAGWYIAWSRYSAGDGTLRCAVGVNVKSSRGAQAWTRPRTSTAPPTRAADSRAGSQRRTSQRPGSKSPRKSGHEAWKRSLLCQRPVRYSASVVHALLRGSPKDFAHHPFRIRSCRRHEALCSLQRDGLARICQNRWSPPPSVPPLSIM